MDEYVSVSYWEDHDKSGWLVLLTWTGPHGDDVCTGIEMRGWCTRSEAYLSGDPSALRMPDNPADAHALKFDVARRMPLALLQATLPVRHRCSTVPQLAGWSRWYDQEIGRRSLRWAKAAKPRQRYVHLSDDEWRRVALVSYAATHYGVPKSRAVALALGIHNPSSTDLARMRKLVERARARMREGK